MAAAMPAGSVASQEQEHQHKSLPGFIEFDDGTIL
jgi:hypothetical protein